MSGTLHNPLRRLVGRKIEGDLRCGQCGYDLRGLRYGTLCPECGTPANGTTRARFTSTLTEAPRAYLSQLLLGCVLMLISGCLVVGLYFLGRTLLPRSSVAPLFPLPAMVVWGAGVWIVTQPRRPGVPENIDHREEWKRVRDAARWSQAGWGLASLMYSAAQSINSGAIAAYKASNGFNASVPLGSLPTYSPPAVFYALNWAGMLGVGCAFLGLAAILLYLALLADWASDTSLAERLKLAAIAIGVCFPLWLLGFVLGPVLGTAYTGLFGMPSSFISFVSVVGTFLWGLSFIVLVIGLIQGGLALVSFVNMSRWAMKNSGEQAASDRRRSDNINRRIREGQMKPRGGRARPAPAVTRPHVPADAEKRGVVTVAPPSPDVPTYELAPELDTRAIRHPPGRAKP